MRIWKPTHMRQQNFRAGVPVRDTLALSEALGRGVDADGVDEYARRDLAVCAQIFRVLIEEYPGWYWQVLADTVQGYATVKIGHLMNGNQAFILHLDRMTSPNDLEREVKRAGGELLERYGLPRRGFDLDCFLNASKKHVRLGRNDPVPN